MKIFVLMAQRKESYPGQYAPEALACMDEFGESDNPEYLTEERSKADGSKEFESTAIVVLEVSDAAIMAALRPATQTIPAAVVA